MFYEIRVGRYSVRPAKLSDIASIAKIDELAFNGFSLTEEVFQGWLEIFPDGFMVAEQHGKVVAYSMAIRVRAKNIRHKWDHDTGNGTCRTHDPEGEILYGVSLASFGSSPGAGSALCLAERRMVEQSSGIKEIHLYGRLRGFASWKEIYAPEMAIKDCLQDYVHHHIDQVETFYELAGLMAIRGVEGYLGKDKESLGCAVLTVWQKPRLGRVHQSKSPESRLVIAA